MNAFIRNASIASVLALTAFGTAGLARADSMDYDDHDCVEETDDCYGETKWHKGDDDEYSGKRRYHDDKTEVTVNVIVNDSKNDWKYDSRKHKRRAYKDDAFRFHHGGYWYAQPYWLVGYGFGGNDRMSCREGRALLRDRGFYRVRPLDCSGRTFSYLGHRHGDTFRVLVSSRTGRIVDVDPI
jgi:hypothetical protein